MTNVNDFAFSRLPLDLIILIIKIAAAPEFPSKWDPYACGLSLCCVSKEVRRTALPSMLHTVFLARRSSVCKFVTALRLQKTFAQTSGTLFIDYALHISKIWITQYPEPPPPFAPSAPQSFHPATPPSDEDDLPLLAPVILGASSLLFDDASMSLLCDCLAWVWHHNATVPSLRSLSLPWRTQKLALHGYFRRWLPFTSSPEGSAFLASIRSLTVLPEVTGVKDLTEAGWDEAYWGIRQVIPLESFRNLRKCVVPLVSFSLSEGVYVNGGYVNIKLLAMEAPTMGSKYGTKQWVNDAVGTYLQGRTTVFTPAYPYLDGGLAPDQLRFGWEQCWPDHLMDD